MVICNITELSILVVYPVFMTISCLGMVREYTGDEKHPPIVF